MKLKLKFLETAVSATVNCVQVGHRHTAVEYATRAMLFLFVLFVAGPAQNCLAEPMDWASEPQKDLASRLASAFGSTEMCDLDINPDRVADLLREKFDERLTARAVSDLMYMVRAVQGVQVCGLKESEIKERCALMLQHFGSNGTDLKGVLR